MLDALLVAFPLLCVIAFGVGLVAMAHEFRSFRYAPQHAREDYEDAR
jgi:hypothetical protein